MNPALTNGQSKMEAAELPNDDPRLIEIMRGVDAYLSRGNVRLQLGLVATKEDVARERDLVRQMKFL
jgi:hypothetical protein